jgi:N-glycosylase/DNA lyase
VPQPALNPMPPGCEILLPVNDYDLDATMTSGQVFTWSQCESGWAGVLGGCWVNLEATSNSIRATTIEPQSEWSKLTGFLQSDVNLLEVLATFPAHDPHLHRAVASCRGLRLLRQDPWECLASFILSSTKQIVQIRQIVQLLCERYGKSVRVPVGRKPAFAFPTAERIAALMETELRTCKMGFRAKYLLSAARCIAEGELDLGSLRHKPLAVARGELMRLSGVGEKIADCVLLFAYGFPNAFPVDVWVARALSEFYFRGRKTPPDRLRRFAARQFGPNSGYAQQYLFHHIRTNRG